MTKAQAIRKISIIINSIDTPKNVHPNKPSRKWIDVTIVRIYQPKLSINAQRFKLTKDPKLKPFADEKTLSMQVVDGNGEPSNVRCYPDTPKQNYSDIQGVTDLPKFVLKHYHAGDAVRIKMVTNKLFTDIRKKE